MKGLDNKLYFERKTYWTKKLIALLMEVDISVLEDIDGFWNAVGEFRRSEIFNNMLR